jgi:hypothetical protein
MSHAFHCTAYCMGHCTGKAALKTLRIEGISPKDFTAIEHRSSRSSLDLTMN